MGDLTGVSWFSPRASEPRDASSPHTCVWLGLPGGTQRFWQCSSCLRTKRNPSHVCPPPGRCSATPRIDVQKLRDLNHKCVIFDCSNDSLIVVCTQCKCYTSGART